MIKEMLQAYKFIKNDIKYKEYGKDINVINAIKKHLKHHGIKFSNLRDIEIGKKYIDFEYLDKNNEWQELNIFSSMVEDKKCQ